MSRTNIKDFIRNEIKNIMEGPGPVVDDREYDSWVGLSTQKVYAELKKMGIENPRSKWWKNYKYSHPARVKYREWYKAKRSGKKVKKTNTKPKEKPLDVATVMKAFRGIRKYPAFKRHKDVFGLGAKAAGGLAATGLGKGLGPASGRAGKKARAKTYRDHIPSDLRFEGVEPKSMRDMIIEEYYAVLSERINQACPPGPSQAECERKRAANRRKYCAKYPDARGCKGVKEKKNFSAKKDDQK